MKHWMKRMLLAIFLLGNALHADALMDGLGAYEKGNYIAASLFFEEACTNDSMEACYNLANMYDSGVGVYKDDVKAVTLLIKPVMADLPTVATTLA